VYEKTVIANEVEEHLHCTHLSVAAANRAPPRPSACPWQHHFRDHMAKVGHQPHVESSIRLLDEKLVLLQHGEDEVDMS
jgi:hypothetical protein